MGSLNHARLWDRPLVQSPRRSPEDVAKPLVRSLAAGSSHLPLLADKGTEREVVTTGANKARVRVTHRTAG
jgi:hypothetical protein